jgi:4-carboxymuconolactone decarboxylase
MAEDTSSINRRWQAFITESAWGECWSDPTLSARDRSLLMLGMTAGLGRADEMEGHTRFAMKNGLTPAELEAVLIQIAVYCGIPAGNMFAKAVQKATGTP